MANFSVNDNPSWVQYTATASQDQFTIPFPFIQDEDIVAWSDDTLLVITTDYTLSGENTASGGLLTLVVPATGGEKITIQNQMAIDRTSIYRASISNLTGSSLNNDFNRDVMMINRAITAIDYLMLQYDPYADISQTISVTRDRIIPILDAGSSWRMNAGGTAIENFSLPDIPIGIVGAFTADNRLTKTDLPAGDNFIQQTTVELTDANLLQTTTGDFTLGSAADLDLTAIGEITFVPGTNLILNGAIWPASGAGEYKVPRFAAGSSTLLEFAYVMTVTGTPTDNAAARFDSTTGAVQNSLVIIDDVGAVSGITELDVDNINIDGNTITATGDLTLGSGTSDALVTQDPTEALGVATKQYVDSALGTGAGGTNGQIQYNNAGAFGGDSITADGSGNWAGSLALTGDLSIDNLNLNGNTLISTDTDGDINITPNGDGEVVLDGVGWSSLTNGQLFIGNTGSVPTAATLTAGSGIGLVNAAGSITISSTGGGGGFTWNYVSGTSSATAAGNGYITDNASLVTLTLPASITRGQGIAVQNVGAGLVRIAQGAGQTLNWGASSTTTGAGGYIEITLRYNGFIILCTTDDTDFCILTPPTGPVTIV